MPRQRLFPGSVPDSADFGRALGGFSLGTGGDSRSPGPPGTISGPGQAAVGALLGAGQVGHSVGQGLQQVL